MASVVVRGLAEHRGVSGILRGGEGVVSPHDAETGVVGGVGLDCSLERAHLEPGQLVQHPCFEQAEIGMLAMRTAIKAQHPYTQRQTYPQHQPLAVRLVLLLYCVKLTR